MGRLEPAATPTPVVLSPRCPNEGEHMVEEGTAVSDIKCANATVKPSHKPDQPGNT